MTPDYHQRFRERFGGGGTFSESVHASASDILAFIDGLKQEWDTQAAIECADHEQKARAEERAALSKLVEGMKMEWPRGYPKAGEFCLADGFNHALRELLTHLRSGSGEEKHGAGCGRTEDECKRKWHETEKAGSSLSGRGEEDVCAICGRTEGDHSYGSHSHGFVKKHQDNVWRGHKETTEAGEESKQTGV